MAVTHEVWSGPPVLLLKAKTQLRKSYQIRCLGRLHNNICGPELTSLPNRSTRLIAKSQNALTNRIRGLSKAVSTVKAYHSRCWGGSISGFRYSPIRRVRRCHCPSSISLCIGIPTFRGAGGMWRKYDATALATPEAFASYPSLVWQFYHYRREASVHIRKTPQLVG